MNTHGRVIPVMQRSAADEVHAMVTGEEDSEP
jgi:hypothetical protein